VNADGFSVSYDTVATRGGLPALPPFAQAVLSGYR
jgi:hypothetical protein